MDGFITCHKPLVYTHCNHVKNKIKGFCTHKLLLLINVCISLIIGGQHTYFYVQQHLRVSSGHLTIIPSRSKFECAFICEKDETCGIANYDSLNSMCEFVKRGMGVSKIAADTTEEWKLLGRKNLNKNRKNYFYYYSYN